MHVAIVDASEDGEGKGSRQVVETDQMDCLMSKRDGLIVKKRLHRFIRDKVVEDGWNEDV